MTDEQRRVFLSAVAEERAGMCENIAAARAVALRLLREGTLAADLIAMLRAAREAAGISLTELEERTGMRKSALSRLENSKAPNPTLATLQRYADAVGKRLTIGIESK
jgi:DNA-binding Xre family transcriptional regulator